MAFFSAVGLALGASAASAAAVGAGATAVAAGAAGAAAKGSAARKGQKAQNNQQAAENEKQRQFEREEAERAFARQRKPYEDAAAKWKQYDFGAPALKPIVQQAAPVPPPPAPMPEEMGGAGYGGAREVPNGTFWRQR